MLEAPEPDYAFGYDAEPRWVIALPVQGLPVAEDSPLCTLLQVMPYGIRQVGAQGPQAKIQHVHTGLGSFCTR
jgi:hypothetical protein